MPTHKFLSRQRDYRMLSAMLPMLAAASIVRAEATFEKLLAEKAPAMVTIKFVMKMEGGYGSHEAELEIDGLIIDPKGTVLTNSRIAGMGGSSGRMTPTDIKILYGGDTEGVEARLLTKDSELDLAWLKIKKPSETPYVYIDLEKMADPKPGDTLLTLRRLDKFFDRALVVAEGKVAGYVEKPRKLLAPSIDLYAGPGAPVFMPDGRLAGVMVMQRPDDEDSGSGRSSGDRMILPADRVAKATQRALESAAEEEEEEDEPAVDSEKSATTKEAEKPAEETKPKEPGDEKKDGE